MKYNMKKIKNLSLLGGADEGVCRPRKIEVLLMHSKFKIILLLIIIFLLCGCSTYYTKFYSQVACDNFDGSNIKYLEQIAENINDWKVLLLTTNTINDPNKDDAMADSFSVEISFQALADESINILDIDVLTAQINILNSDKPLKLNVARKLSSEKREFKSAFKWYDIVFEQIYLPLSVQEINLELKLNVSFENDSTIRKEWSLSLYRHEKTEKGYPAGLFH